MNDHDLQMKAKWVLRHIAEFRAAHPPVDREDEDEDVTWDWTEYDYYQAEDDDEDSD